MAGQDKPLLTVDGLPMAQRIAQTVSPTTQIWISANRNLDQYAAWGQPFSDYDVLSNDQRLGPLVGILGGLQRCQAPWLLVSPGDTPFLADHWYVPLLQGRNAQGAVVHDGTRQQNLHLLLAKSLATELAGYLAEGEVRVWPWLSLVDLAQVTIEQPEGFANINTHADIDRTADSKH